MSASVIYITGIESIGSPLLREGNVIQIFGRINGSRILLDF